MKTKILSVVIICLPIFVWGQISITARDTLPKVEVTPPEFTGIVNVNKLFNNSSMNDIGNYLSENFQYPKEAVKCRLQGTGVVQFVVTVEGELTDFNIINSVCPMIDEEFIRVLKTSDGMWKPGFNNGKPVPMEKEVSMMFVISEANKNAPKEYFKRLATNYWKKGNEKLLKKNNLKRAIKNYDEAIKYMPYDCSALLVRGLCKYELGDKSGARADWERINRIGSFDASPLIDELTFLEGYNEMIATIEK